MEITLPEHIYQKSPSLQACKTIPNGRFSKDKHGKVYVWFKGALRKLLWDDVKQEQFIFQKQTKMYLQDLGMKQYVPEEPTIATQLIAKVDQQTDLQACKSCESQPTES